MPFYEEENHVQFFTAVCNDWQPLLQSDDCKSIILNSLKYRVQTKQVKIGALVLMPNHIHLIWRIANSIKREEFQRDFLKITAKQIIDNLQRTNTSLLQKIIVNATDRKMQVWKRDSMSIDLYTHPFFLQKLEYIHNNPCQPKWNLVGNALDYLYSSARFYETGEDRFELLTHYNEL
jgi:REP element-mobilizing transposase RayT